MYLNVWTLLILVEFPRFNGLPEAIALILRLTQFIDEKLILLPQESFHFRFIF